MCKCFGLYETGPEKIEINSELKINVVRFECLNVEIVDFLCVKVQINRRFGGNFIEI